MFLLFLHLVAYRLSTSASFSEIGYGQEEAEEPTDMEPRSRGSTMGLTVGSQGGSILNSRGRGSAMDLTVGSQGGSVIATEGGRRLGMMSGVQRKEDSANGGDSPLSFSNHSDTLSSKAGGGAGASSGGRGRGGGSAAAASILRGVLKSGGRSSGVSSPLFAHPTESSHSLPSATASQSATASRETRSLSVVVKVQHENIGAIMLGDMIAAVTLSQLAARLDSTWNVSVCIALTVSPFDRTTVPQ